MKKKSVNENEIRNVEINSFIKYWMKHTNVEMEIGNVNVNQHDAIRFYQEFLGSFLKNRKRHRIYGSDVMSDFEMCIAEDELFMKTCQNIWDTPENYYKLENQEDSNYYYDFLKYLWYESDTFGNGRLTDLVNTKTIA
jgi:hypothetical protein